eukprot:4580171-Pleurochrysis_carterae.AAC.6
MEQGVQEDSPAHALRSLYATPACAYASTAGCCAVAPADARGGARLFAADELGTYPTRPLVLLCFSHSACGMAPWEGALSPEASKHRGTSGRVG